MFFPITPQNDPIDYVSWEPFDALVSLHYSPVSALLPCTYASSSSIGRHGIIWPLDCGLATEMIMVNRWIINKWVKTFYLV